MNCIILFIPYSVLVSKGRPHTYTIFWKDKIPYKYVLTHTFNQCSFAEPDPDSVFLGDPDPDPEKYWIWILYPQNSNFLCV